MHPAQAMIAGVPTPAGAVLVGYIDRHPADKSGLGYAVLYHPATGIEDAWDGHRTRSLPKGWRDRVTLTPVSTAATIGRLGGIASTDAKAAAARANGVKGGRPRKRNMT